MQTTKHEILAILKRTGSNTVEAIAQGTGLAPVTVRQHLTALERDKLVAVAAVRRSTGRPHYEYTLTRSGEDTFPRRYDRLAEGLIEEFALMDLEKLAPMEPPQRTAFLIRRLSHRLALQYAPRVQNQPLEQRVAAVADILAEEGGFAEWEKTDSGFEIRDYNCLFGNLPSMNGSGCEWHSSLLRWLLGAPVRALPVDDCVRCCRFLIDMAPVNGTQNGASVVLEEGLADR